MIFDFDTIELKNGKHVKYGDLLDKIATYLFVETSKNTTTDTWRIYFGEIEEYYLLEDGFIDEEMANDIIDRLYDNFDKMIADHDIYYEKGGYDEEKGYYVECDRYFNITLFEECCAHYLDDDQSILENRE